ncbi:hypothetical protein CK203_089635 [Vitis vinifera]|uniref:Uncharacterized protein n=1 Tax=Vitis vinifera TaxID=29760 RepID=A0A438EYN0_VITVI|nr:hypothetical protein CK203_089635 [Vitis vinifera]
MKLNPFKCAFGVSADKFLGFMRLTGKLVVLGRFIARFTDELRPFFLAIRKAGRCSIPLPLAQGAETYLLRQQSLGGRRNKVFKDGANGLGSSKCRPEAPPLLPSPPGGRVNRPAPSQHPAQAGLNRKNASMGHRVEYEIEFQPRLSMKGQVMADFVLEYSRRPIQRKEPSEKEWWTLRVDGASRSSGSGVGLLLQSQQENIWSKPSD